MSHNDNQKREAFLRYGLICEMYFGRMMQIKEIAVELNCNVATVSKAISRYLELPVYPITLSSVINDDRSYIKSVWKKQSIRDMAKQLNKHPSHIIRMGSDMLLARRTEFKRKRNYTQPKCDMIINLETGIFYTTAKEAAYHHNIHLSTLNRWFQGKGNCNGLRYLINIK